MASPITGAILIRTTAGIIVAIQYARMTVTKACVVKVAGIGHSAENLVVLRIPVAVTSKITIGVILIITGVIAVIQTPHVLH
ncbi:hypothetical protein CHS0354_007136, partial [Potamilus streckersoni]